MLDLLSIENFKNISQQDFTFKPVMIFTGLNSTGKSTVIQALLLLASGISKNTLLNQYVKKFSNYSEVRNKYKNAKDIKIQAVDKKSLFSIEYKILQPYNTIEYTKESKKLIFEQDIYYISSNRIGQEDLVYFDSEIKFGIDGKYAFGYYEQHKDKVVAEKLIASKEHRTLDAQLSYWLRYILDLNLRVRTEKITPTHVKVSFDIDGLENISPYNLGAGNSYLAKILIMGLFCKEDDIIIIENPEIHLHPKAQSKIADFFTFLQNANIQVVLETHSEHLINKFRYNVYKSKILHENILIYYKKTIQDKFYTILISENGHFLDTKNEEIEFPKLYII